ncbi:ankyrin repeat domain-containing protein 50 [Entelurus aequoreus]|uniref:ankyrin repeat domain-containing protein 50 n=1 Tax=Entelurus aequoreus TaxID=161455 RepID=UPI002B1DF19F|nr:ankyrin repeat domain-containing protein 50 [Entelurus aequoreus]XP_061895872.1 ankyrin repeat domain-containing protein 50 [Entelurus aequoreus]XP_061895873.1 ankyrin repeat domain-containing protein 50 [Entelurus aequoreus]XP_061895874.1 ankyrin repeat domain-containing protein 50 [Entelurus aequoreus]
MKTRRKQHSTMAQSSLLQGKRFYCREWVFHKIQHCLQEKSDDLGGATGTPAKQPAPVKGGNSWGVLLVGGPGSGKTALCTELLWPTSAQGTQRGLHQRGLAFHFCRADDSDTTCVAGFVRRLVAQICRGGLVPGYEEKVRDPAVQGALQPGECERNPTEAFKRCVLLPLLSAKPPPQALFLLVDSVDQGGQLGEAEQRSPADSPRTIAELLATHQQFLPPWLLLVCSARRQNKAITKLFTGVWIRSVGSGCLQECGSDPC